MAGYAGKGIPSSGYYEAFTPPRVIKPHRTSGTIIGGRGVLSGAASIGPTARLKRARRTTLMLLTT